MKGAAMFVAGMVIWLAGVAIVYFIYLEAVVLYGFLTE